VPICEIGWTHGARHAVAPGFGLKKSVPICEIGWTHDARHAVTPGFGLKKSVPICEIGWTHDARHAVAPGFGLKKSVPICEICGRKILIQESKETPAMFSKVIAPVHLCHAIIFVFHAGRDADSGKSFMIT
jgi:hypothetical protein